MTKVVVKELVFDDYNLEHIQKHGVTRAECEKVSQDFLYHRRTHTERYIVVGRFGTRILTLVVKRRGAGVYYLVTARDASRKERQDLYEKEKS